MSTIGPKQWHEINQVNQKNRDDYIQIDLGYRAALNQIQGMEPLSFGSTIDGLASTDGTVLFYEAVLGVPSPLSAATVYLVSSSASDTGTYRIEGLDASGNLQTANVTATGTTPVAFSGTWSHVQRVIHTTALGSNVGTVYVSTDSGAVPTTVSDQIQCAMKPGDNYAINPVLVCPNNHVILIDRFDFTADSNNPGEVNIFANRQGTWILNFRFYVTTSSFRQEFPTPLRLYEGDKIRVTIALSSGSSASVGFGMNGVVIRQDPPALDENRVHITDWFNT